MAVIHILENGRKIGCNEGENLLKALHEAAVFVENPCNGTGVCGKCRVRILSENVTEMTETEARLLSRDDMERGIRLACMTYVTGDIDIELPGQERGGKVLTEGFVPDFERDKHENGYGVAVDIGTTTVVVSLIDLKSGEEVSSASAVNAQKRFGLDVLTRITYEYNNPEKGKTELQAAIVSQLDSLISRTARDACVDTDEIKEVAVSANCTMTHMLLGVDARSLGRAPYAPLFREAQRLMCRDIGIKSCKGARLYCLPHVSAYIGSDIVAGAYVTGMEREEGKVLFIDIGTNGEIVLADKGRLLCCSCAAGPALEGTNISCGMRAAEGAVEDVIIGDEYNELTVIGDTVPVGLCGSGILAAVRELLRSGYVRQSGAFVGKTDESDKRLILKGGKRAFVLSEEAGLVITQEDVRQVQLAKGAILSGVTALLRRAGIAAEELDRVLIAGQFGAHLPVRSLVGVGILPEDTADKLVYVGNTSKTGAYMALMSRKIRAEMEALALKMEYIELAETENYEMLFAESMRFPKLTGGK